MIDYGKFDKMVNLEGLKSDIKEAENGSGTYDEVPNGTYEVKIEKLELGESKKGDPMLVCWFKIQSDYQHGRLIFMNQILRQGFQLHICNEFLRSLDTGLDVHFDNFMQYGQLIFEISRKIESEKLEFSLVYGKKGDFPTFKITEVFDAIPY